MPELKEAIEICKVIESNFDKRNYPIQYEALQKLVEVAELLEQVEKGGVEKKGIHQKIAYAIDYYLENCDKKTLRDSLLNGICQEIDRLIDLSNAHLVKKLEGIREIIQNAILFYQVNEASISCQYLKDNPKSLIDCLAQAIKTYLTKKEE